VRAETFPTADFFSEELPALAPDVILASATPSVQALQRTTRTVPIVFAVVSDPVAPASSKAWHGRVATPQASCSSSSA
jgi:ABC-type uncharacterized transport system substrate-binding protein